MDQPPYAVSTGQVMTLQSLQPTFLRIGDLVTIKLADGSIVYSEGYKPDAAAKILWEAVSGEYREYLKWKAEHPEPHIR